MLLKKIYLKILYELRNTRFKYDKLYIFKINLFDSGNENKTYEVTKASSINDLKDICEERKGNFADMYKVWLQKGNTCFIVKNEDSTDGIVWLNNTNVVPLEFGYHQKLKDNTEAGLIDAYVLRGKRGKGVYKAIWNKSLQETKKMGITTLYGYILNNNTQSMKVHYKLGMKNVYQILYYYKILWFKLYYVKTLKHKTDILDLKRKINFDL